MTTECTEIVGQICERMCAVNAELVACRAEVAKLSEENDNLQADRLQLQIERNRILAEVDRLTTANASHEINAAASWADYKDAVSHRERYHAALVAISAHSNTPNPAQYFVDWRGRLQEAELIALNALAIRRTESDAVLAKIGS